MALETTLHGDLNPFYLSPSLPLSSNYMRLAVKSQLGEAVRDRCLGAHFIHTCLGGGGELTGGAADRELATSHS
jgi:hypothetical protein